MTARRAEPTRILLLAVLAAATGCSALGGVRERVRPAQPQVAIRPDAPAEYDLLVAQQLAHDGRNEEAVDAYLRAAEKDPDSAYLRQRAAVALAQVNRLDEAVEHARRALEIDPGDEATRLFLGQLYRIERRTGDAEDVLTSRPGEPVSADAAFLLYQTFLDAGRFDDALTTARWMVEHAPEDQRGRIAIANVYRRTDRAQEAEQALRDALKQDPENLRLYGELARMLRQRGAYEKEAVLYRDVLAEFPDHHATLVALGEAQIALEDVDGAIATFRRVEKRYPDDLQSAVRLGYLYFEQDDLASALERFERVLEREPEEYEVAFFLGVVARRMGDIGGAQRAFEQIPESHRYFPEARSQVASIYERRGDYAQALRELRSALEVRETREMRLYAATLMAKGGELDAAVEYVEEMIAEEPDDDELMFNLGVVYGEADQVEKAIDTMHRVLKRNPNNASALNYIGYTWAERGIRLDEAEDLINRAIELRPADGYIVDSLGWVYYMRARPLVESGRWTEARPLLDRALAELRRAHELTGGDPVISEHLGDTYLLLEQRERALESFEEAVRLEPRESEQPRLLDKLELLQRELR